MKKKQPYRKCCVVEKGDEVALCSPCFVYSLKTSSGLQLRSWENKLAGYEISLSGPEIEMDIDAADRRIWITGWKNRHNKAKDAVTSPDEEEGYLQGFHMPYVDDRKITAADGPTSPGGYVVPCIDDNDWGNWGGWEFHVGGQQSPEDYYWARTHVFLPKDAQNRPLSLTLGGLGLYDYRYLRVFVNGHETGVRNAPERWHEPGVFDIGPRSSVYKHLRFGQDNIVAIQATGAVTRPNRLNDLDSSHAKWITAPGWWSRPFEQYLTIGTQWNTPDFQVTDVRVIKEGDLGEVIFELQNHDSGLSVLITYKWDATTPVLHKFAEISNKNKKAIRLMQVRIGDYKIAHDIKTSDGEQGVPVYLNDDFFLSVAHPAGWAMGQPGKISLRQYPGKEVPSGSSFVCMETVQGVAHSGTARKSFLSHVRTRCRRVLRKHDKPYAIFEPFGAKQEGQMDGNMGYYDESEEFLLDNIAKVAEGQRAAKYRFDFYLIDFWSDIYGDLQLFDRKRFKNGLAKINPELGKLGILPGLWIDSSSYTTQSSWGIGGNPALADCNTIPGVSPNIYPSISFCRAADPAKTMYASAFKHHLRENGIRLCKFDNFHSICHNPYHDHLPGVYSIEAIYNAFIEFLRELDEECPDVFLMLYWGFRSPWWLLFADTLSESGLQIEAANPGAFPTLYARDSITIGLDQAQWWCEDVPPLGKDSLGVWLSDWKWNSSVGKERWQEGFVMDICRGSLLAQPWSDSNWLSPDERKQMAEFIGLLKASPECFGNPRFILDNPWKNKPYGYCCSDGKRAFVALNNCSWSDNNIKMELNSKWGLPDDKQWDIYRWYPNPAKLEEKQNSIALRPFEVVLLELVPSGESPSLKRRFVSEAIPEAFVEASRELALNISFPENAGILIVPREIDQPTNAPARPPKRVLMVKGKIPACKNGGTLVVVAEMIKKSKAYMINDIGKYFAVQSYLSGREIKCQPIFQQKTYPVNWQGWRIQAGPAEVVHDFEQCITVMADNEVQMTVKGHFIPN